MRRLFWLAAGVGAGVAGAVLTSRWARRQAERMAPARLARRAGGGLVELGKLVAESLEEGRRTMREAEEEARRRLEEERQAARG